MLEFAVTVQKVEVTAYSKGFGKGSIGVMSIIKDPILIHSFEHGLRVNRMQ